MHAVHGHANVLSSLTFEGHPFELLTRFLPRTYVLSFATEDLPWLDITWQEGHGARDGPLPICYDDQKLPVLL